ncbi:Sua5 family C-terminal domain-containing protein [Gracilibacillus sp. JCM 18860]|uniref:Sua5 family C-terminal domain-containing protein n=1 Tax=Gracilibacillus sp. JCM 18860 TaxID=1306159 RepID=UPI003260E2B4
MEIVIFSEADRSLSKKHYKVGVLASDSLMDELDADQLFPCGGENDKEIAAKLYDGLRYFNHTNVDLILAEAFSTDGVGQAIMNRLSKAASDHLYQTK